MKTDAFALLGVMACAPLTAQNSSTIAQEFKNPPKAYRPMVRWWWPGGDVTDVELRREVTLLDQANFGGGEIQPFVIGLHSDMPAGTRKRVDDYLTPTFYAHVRAALEKARDRGMWMDYTFGSGWPFGGAGVPTPELSAVELRSTHQSIRGPVHFHAALPMPRLSEDIATNHDLPAGWLHRFQKREKLVAVVAVRGDAPQYFQSQSTHQQQSERLPGHLDPGTSVVLTSHLSRDGTLDWDVPAEYLAKYPHIFLDLGDVKDVAEISINRRKPGPVILLRPYRADVTGLLHSGENSLQVTVVNTQYNALSAHGADRNFIPGPTNTENGLMPSGLMGPVRLEAVITQQ